MEDNILRQKSTSLAVDLRVQVAGLAVLHHDVEGPVEMKLEFKVEFSKNCFAKFIRFFTFSTTVKLGYNELGYTKPQF